MTPMRGGIPANLLAGLPEAPVAVMPMPKLPPPARPILSEGGTVLPTAAAKAAAKAHGHCGGSSDLCHLSDATPGL